MALKEDWTIEDLRLGVFDLFVLKKKARTPYKFYRNGDLITFYGEKTRAALKELLK